MQPFRVFALIPSVLVLLTVAESTARANAIYIYTGNAFTTAAAPYSTSDFVSVSFTFANPLLGNTTNSNTTLISWTITDQVDSLDSASALLTSYSFSTDASGNISSWDITVISFAQLFGGGGPTISTTSIQTDCSTASCVEDLGENNSGTHAANNFSDPGTWTLATAEPSTVGLGSLGGAILLFAVRRKHSPSLTTP